MNHLIIVSCVKHTADFLLSTEDNNIWKKKSLFCMSPLESVLRKNVREKTKKRKNLKPKSKNIKNQPYRKKYWHVRYVNTMKVCIR